MTWTPPAAAVVAIAIATVIALAVSGCSGTKDKAGGEVAPITLTLYDTSAVTSGAAFSARFARRVSEISHGAVKVSADWSKIDPARDDIDPFVIARVRQGKAALGIVAVRAFDLLGVTSLRGLQAPFLISSDALADAVATDPLAARMLEGLDGVGLVGLALTPEVLRHPITAAAPLLAPSDFRGATIAIRPSRTTEAVMHALGTTTRIDNGPRLVTGIEGRSIKGFEGQLVTAAPFSYSDLVATGNITFSVKALAVIVNRRVWNSLYDSQRDVLRRAALEARDWWIANRPTDVQLGRLWCKQGGTIAQASPAELAALERATVPVTTGLEQDPFTAKAIQRIRELKRGLGPQPAVAACGTHPANHVAPVPQRGDQSVLDGRWRVRVSRTELRAAGVSEEEASQTGGTWTLTIGDARVAAVRRASGGTTRCDASIFIRGARLSLVWDPGSACKDDLDGTFARTGDTIRIVPTAPAGHAVRFNSAFFGHGMQLLRLRP